MTHPHDVLLGAQAAAGFLPVCDHYSGVPARMKKSLDLQAEMIQQWGACVFDVTLDCEDGAPVGGEVDHANAVLAGVSSAKLAINSIVPRVGVRLHAVDHAAFASDVEIIVGGAAKRLAYVTLPKIECPADIDRAALAIDAAGGAHLPLHALIESSAAVHRAFDIAAHPRVQSISFGLMDFVSSHGGAIPADAMTSGWGASAGRVGQFSHPLVLRAKLEIAAACHAYGKVPSHCVVTEFTDTAALQASASAARSLLGYSRMWSIHPAQIPVIVAAFAPTDAEIDQASTIVEAAARADWAPISVAGQLHDRASYRYYWQVLQRAVQTGRSVPAAMQTYFELAQQPAGAAQLETV